MTAFGPAGIPISCKGSNVDGIRYSGKIGLNAYEINFSRGVRISDDAANSIRRYAEKNNIRLSCHAPYFINCNNPDKYEITRRHLINSIAASEKLGLRRIVFHTGFLLGSGRSNAVKESIKTIKKIVSEANEMGFHNFVLGPEVAGKKSQIGTMEDLIEICKECRECRPVIDWAHLHALSNGGLKKRKDFIRPLEMIREELGKSYLNGLHCHFSEIEYTEKGEKRHHPLGSGWGPDFHILAEVIRDMKLDLTIISESPLIEMDALRMKAILNNAEGIS